MNRSLWILAKIYIVSIHLAIFEKEKKNNIAKSIHRMENGFCDAKIKGESQTTDIMTRAPD